MVVQEGVVLAQLSWLGLARVLNRSLDAHVAELVQVSLIPFNLQKCAQFCEEAIHLCFLFISLRDVRQLDPVEEISLALLLERCELQLCQLGERCIQHLFQKLGLGVLADDQWFGFSDEVGHTFGCHRLDLLVDDASLDELGQEVHDFLH